MKQSILLIGNIGNDAVVKKVNDFFVVEFSLASTIKNKKNEKITTWYDCSFTRSKEPTNLMSYLKKGQKLFIGGDLSFYQGEKALYKKVAVVEFNFL